MISIICPFYNEKENLKELYDRLVKMTKTLDEPWEIIFVNDGSTDEGGVHLQSLIVGQHTVRLIELDKNYGLSTALLAGFHAAKGETLATLDSDLQNPPEEIPALLRLLEGADMVTGIRKKRQDSWLRRIISRIANFIRKKVTGDTIQDVGCTLRVFRRDVVEAFYPYKGMHRFFAALTEAHGFKVKQVPVSHHKRRYGKAKYGFWNRLAGPLMDLLAVKWLLKRKIKYKVHAKQPHKHR
ncbi:MAG TPA: glycosyltransferase family 2 protein [bacterium]|nr:glycosyltransferase family 2 protein [bacterium]